MVWRRILTCALVFLMAQAAWAGPGLDPREQLPDAAAETRARALFKQLRCVVCQSESLDDSEAELARDMRHLIRAQIASGKSDADVVTHLTSRYGDFVLLSPPSRPSTWALWFGPFALLAIVLTLVGWFLARRRGTALDAPLSSAEAEALADARRNLPPG
jgi:cytochrome c-type biogenesis protein CcmH